MVENLGRRVRMMRKQRGWSLRQLAERAGEGVVSHVAISDIERGKTAAPGIDVLEGLAGAFGVPLSELTGEQEAGTSEADELARIAARFRMTPEQVVEALHQDAGIDPEDYKIVILLKEELRARAERRTGKKPPRTGAHEEDENEGRAVPPAPANGDAPHLFKP